MVAKSLAPSTSRNRAWKDLARAAGVSPATASLALNNHPRVAPHTRQRVVEAAAKLGFVRNHGALRLARTRSNVRGAAFEQIGLMYLVGAEGGMDGVCLEIMRGAEQELARLHASLLFVRAGARADWEKIDRLTQSGGVDGWLVIGQTKNEEVNRLKAGGLPFVIVGDQISTQPVHNVNVDNSAVARLAVQHLAALGHRRIAYLGGTMELGYQRQTLAGFRAALREFELDDRDESLIVDVSIFKRYPQAEGIAQWLFGRSGGENPTALFSGESTGAETIIRLLERMDKRIPRDLSVVGAEPQAWPASRPEGITRVESPMAELGRHGALLLHRIASEPGLTSSEMKIAPSLVTGWSTAPVRTSDAN